MDSASEDMDSANVVPTDDLTSSPTLPDGVKDGLTLKDLTKNDDPKGGLNLGQNDASTLDDDKQDALPDVKQDALTTEASSSTMPDDLAGQLKRSLSFIDSEAHDTTRASSGRGEAHSKGKIEKLSQGKDDSNKSKGKASGQKRGIHKGKGCTKGGSKGNAKGQSSGKQEQASGKSSSKAQSEVL
eukprot:s13_g37.t1